MIQNKVESYNSYKYSLKLIRINLETDLDMVATKKISQIFKYTSLDWNTKWDGISCEDNKKNLYFEKPTDYA